MKPEDIIARQKSDAAKSAAASPQRPLEAGGVPAVHQTDSPIDRYIAKAGGNSQIIGRLIKFLKNGDWVYSDTEKKLPDDAEYLAHVDQVATGWIKFNGEGNPPEKIMGRLFDGFDSPEREELGDNDPEQWPAGLSGKPEDPWKETALLVLENTKSRDFVTYNPSTTAQVNAVRRLLATYRLRMQTAGLLPIVKLQKGGYQHKQYGWITLPEFQVRGNAKTNGSPVAPTTAASDMNDELPW